MFELNPCIEFVIAISDQRKIVFPDVPEWIAACFCEGLPFAERRCRILDTMEQLVPFDGKVLVELSAESGVPAPAGHFRQLCDLSSRLRAESLRLQGTGMFHLLGASISRRHTLFIFKKLCAPQCLCRALDMCVCVMFLSWPVGLCCRSEKLASWLM